MIRFDDNQLNALEIAVFRDIFNQQIPPYREQLTSQFQSAKFQSREMTDAGFYTRLEISFDAEKFQNSSNPIGDIHIEADGLKNGCGCTLWLKDGYIDCLECFTYGEEPWPDTIKSFEINHAQKN